MTALAQGGEIVWLAVGGIMIEMGTGQDNAGGTGDAEDVVTGLADPAPLAVPPALAVAIPPATIAKMDDRMAMRASAMLAFAACPAEADGPRQLYPIDRV